MEIITNKQSEVIRVNILVVSDTLKRSDYVARNFARKLFNMDDSLFEVRKVCITPIGRETELRYKTKLVDLYFRFILAKNLDIESRTRRWIIFSEEEFESMDFRDADSVMNRIYDRYNDTGFLSRFINRFR